MLKSKKNIVFSLVVLFAMIVALGAKTITSEFRDVEKKELTKESKEEVPTDLVKISSLSEATFQLLTYNVNAALIFMFALVLIPVVRNFKITLSILKIEVSYWSNLFTSTIIVNAP